jgi:hypothetical protein
LSNPWNHQGHSHATQIDGHIDQGQINFIPGEWGLGKPQKHQGGQGDKKNQSEQELGIAGIDKPDFPEKDTQPEKKKNRRQFYQNDMHAFPFDQASSVFSSRMTDHPLIETATGI